MQGKQDLNLKYRLLFSVKVINLKLWLAIMFPSYTCANAREHNLNYKVLLPLCVVENSVRLSCFPPELAFNMQTEF